MIGGPDEFRSRYLRRDRATLSQLSYRTVIGGGGRNRTDDLLRARQLLSLLSYTPMIGRGTWIRTKETSRSQSERSTRLSYTPKIVGAGGRNRTASGDFGDRNVTVTPHRNNIEGFCVTEIPQNDPATLFTTDLA